MPQASDEVRAKAREHGWDGDGEAWAYLKSVGWEEKHFVLYPPIRRCVIEKEWDAVAYLCDEWDWALSRIGHWVSKCPTRRRA